MTFTFDPVREDGPPRVFGGMWRPPTLGAVTPLAVEEWLRRSHRVSYAPDDLRHAWQDGAFDRPLYVLEDAA